MRCGYVEVKQPEYIIYMQAIIKEQMNEGKVLPLK